jgi:subtilisin family serine protease
VAGNHTATAVTSPGYLTWLQNAGLRTAANQQTVCVMDLGYDDGQPWSGTQHPDLPTGARIVDAKSFVTGSTAVPDAFGHGTFVAGIIAGNGAGGTVDGQGFRVGLGIAPDAKLVIAQIRDKAAGSCGYSTQLTATALGQVLDFCRATSSGVDKALVVNYSQNGTINYWDLEARLFDQRVIDGYSAGSTEPLTIVVSAGNKGTGDDSMVQSPATGRNVIAVGSTQSYRPSTEAGAPPLACTGTFANSPTEEANDLSKVSSYSSRGAPFGPGTSATVLFTRVKPDLVAPGGRAMSPVPLQSQDKYICQGLCRKYWLDPPSGNNYHSYAQGTSFSAPVVSGVAALVRKWFLDRTPSINPSPALVKASLIATADDIGTTDHRPSNASGWGRVNLKRATDPAARFYIDNAPVSTGGYLSLTKTIDDPTKATFVVLAWSDATPGTLTTTPIGPLVNNLSLSVDRAGAAIGWRGNNFNEVLLGTDDGYSYTYTFGGSLDDTINTVEAVFLPPNTFTAGQQVIIRVVGIDVPNGPQPIAVYAYNVRP